MKNRVAFRVLNAALQSKMADVSAAAVLFDVPKALKGACAVAAILAGKVSLTSKLAVLKLPLGEFARKMLNITTIATTVPTVKNTVRRVGDVALIDGDIEIVIAGNMYERAAASTSVCVNADAPAEMFFATAPNTIKMRDPQVDAPSLTPVSIWHGATRKARVAPLLRTQPLKPVSVLTAALPLSWLRYNAYNVNIHGYTYYPMMLSVNKRYAVYVEDYVYSGVTVQYTVDTDVFANRPYKMDMIEVTRTISLSVGAPYSLSIDLPTLKNAHNIPCVITATYSAEGVFSASAVTSSLYAPVLNRTVITVLSISKSESSATAEVKIQIFDDGAPVHVLYPTEALSTGASIPRTQYPLWAQKYDSRRFFPMGLTGSNGLSYTIGGTFRHGRCVPGGYNRLDKYIVVTTTRNTSQEYYQAPFDAYTTYVIRAIGDDGVFSEVLTERKTAHFDFAPTVQIEYLYDVLDEEAGLSIAPIESLDVTLSSSTAPHTQTPSPGDQNALQKYLVWYWTNPNEGAVYEGYAAYHLYSTEYQYGKQLLVLAGGASTLDWYGNASNTLHAVGVVSGAAYSEFTESLTFTFFEGAVIFCGRRLTGLTQYHTWDTAGTDGGSSINALGSYAASCTKLTQATLVMFSVRREDIRPFLTALIASIIKLTKSPSEATWAEASAPTPSIASVINLMMVYKTGLNTIADNITAASTGVPVNGQAYNLNEYSTPVFRTFWGTRITLGTTAADAVVAALNNFNDTTLAPLKANVGRDVTAASGNAAVITSIYASACSVLSDAYDALGANIVSTVVVTLKNDLKFQWKALATMPPESELS